MTKANYGDMRAGITTDVFVPLFPNKNYTLHVYATIANPQRESCEVISPSRRRTRIKITNGVLNQLQFPISARRENSGLYSVSCSFKVHDQVAGMDHSLKAEKSLNITFIEGMHIISIGIIPMDRVQIPKPGFPRMKASFSRGEGGREGEAGLKD